MTFIDVLLEGGPTFKTYLDKGREGLKSEDFRGDVSTITLRLQRYRVREKTVLLNEADSPDVCRLFWRLVRSGSRVGEEMATR